MTNTSKPRSNSNGTEVNAKAIIKVTNTQSYFIERDSAAFRALLSNSLKLGQIFRSTWQQGDTTFVRLVNKPDVANWVPDTVKHAFLSSEDLEFVDVIEYRASEIVSSPYRLHITSESPYLGQRFSLHATLTFTELDDGTCLQQLQGIVNVKILGIGKLVERIISNSVQNTYAKLPGIVAQWEKLREKAVRQGNPGLLLAGRPPLLGSNVAWINQMASQQQSDDGGGGGGVSIPQGVARLNDADCYQDIDTSDGRSEFFDAHEELYDDENDNYDNDDGTRVYSLQEIIKKERRASVMAMANAVPLRVGDGDRDQRHHQRSPVESFVVAHNASTDDDHHHHPSSNSSSNASSWPPSKQHKKPISMMESWQGSSTSDGLLMDVSQRTPGSKGAQKAWGRFNSEFSMWHKYWSSHQKGTMILSFIGYESASCSLHA